MRSILRTATLVALTVAGTAVSVSAQFAAPQAPPAAPGPEVRRLTADEAVRAALENNLGVQVARIDPQIQDLGIAQARAAWMPSFSSTFQSGSTDSPANSFLSGGAAGTTDSRVVTNFGLDQPTKWGGLYSVGWDNTRSTTTNLFTNFSPQIRSSLALSIRQPLLRNFSIDSPRQQLEVSRKNREIADVTLRQTVVSTERAVRNSYWELAYAIANLAVQQQSLELANTSLRNTRARVEIGTTPPIDVVEAEAEVALREEGVILAEAQIRSAEDTLRALVYDPAAPDFWTLRIEPSELPPFQPVVIDLNAAVQNALANRTDVQQARKNIEANDINIRFFRNQTLPDITAAFDYGLVGLGGTQFVRGQGFPGPIIGQSQRGFGTVLTDLFTNDFPAWTASLNISYPIGASPQQANLARARLQYSQSLAQLRNQELQVSTQVRETGRQVQTNQRRVETTRASRGFAERRLEAEERKFAAGTSTSFFVFQAQRDLALARNNELRAILDYNRSLVDFETVQEAPLR
jgi:outer membrane protein